MKSRVPNDKPSEVQDAVATGPALLSLHAPVLQTVAVDLDARLGDVSLSVQSLLALRQGSVLTLDRQLNELIELRLNGVVVARGEIVAVDDRFGVRIVEVAALT